MESAVGLLIFILIMVFRIMEGLNEAARKRQAPPQPARPARPAPEAVPSSQPRPVAAVRAPAPSGPAAWVDDVPGPTEELVEAVAFDLAAIRQGIVLAEVLGPPRALRRHHGGRR
ncbi:MAG: hypothetical protein AB1492_00620 [Bacillota bacterium]